jgi:hypothetical protein
MLNRWWALLLLLSGTLSYAAKPIPKAQELFAPYWSSEPGWDTELQLKNNLSSSPLTVTPVLRTASGQEIQLTPVTIPANDSVSVWANEGLLEHSPGLLSQPGSYGSVVFRYTSVATMSLHATAIVMLHGQPIMVPIRAHAEGEEAAKSGSGEAVSTLEGIWWQPRAGLNDVLVISNSSEKKVSGNVSLLDASGKRWNSPVTLGPHQTERLSMTELLQKSELSGSYGGISLQLPPSSVDAVHFMYDEAGKFSALLDMFPRDFNASLRERAGKDAKQWILRAPMLALRSPDPAVGLPAGTVLQPTIFVRNTTSKRISAQIALNWRGPSGGGQAKLPELQLAPFATQQLQIGAMEKLLQIPDNAHWALVSLSTNALPDDVIAMASSRDKTGRYGVEAKFIGGQGGYFAGGEWQIDANHNAIAAITNVGIKATDALLTLHYDGGKQKYELQQTIAPGDQMWVNLAQLVRQRIPDRKGNVLPVDVSTATYDVRDLTSGSHSLIATEVGVGGVYGSQVIPDCAECCGGESPAFDPGLVDLFIGDTDPLVINETNSCNGSVENVTDDFSDWGSDNTGVATLSTGQVYGVAVGSTTGYADGLIIRPSACGCTPAEVQVQLPVNVQTCPSSITLSSTTPFSLQNNFPSLETGIGIVAFMQVNPTSSNWNNTQVTELVETNIDTCPSNVPKCSALGPLTVGTAGNGYGLTWNAQNDIVWDEHIKTDPSSLLNASGVTQTSCTLQCVQTYYCPGSSTALGSFTITYGFDRGTINGTDVTNVTATEQ